MDTQQRAKGLVDGLISELRAVGHLIGPSDTESWVQGDYIHVTAQLYGHLDLIRSARVITWATEQGARSMSVDVWECGTSEDLVTGPEVHVTWPVGP